MIDRMIQSIDATVGAEIALVLFAVAFLAIFIRTALKSQGTISEQARLPLDDGTRRRNDG